MYIFKFIFLWFGDGTEQWKSWLIFLDFILIKYFILYATRVVFLYYYNNWDSDISFPSVVMRGQQDDICR